MRASAPVILFGLSFALGAPLGAQAGDEGTLIVRQQGEDIGREDFRFRPNRPGRAAGDSLITIARYPATRSITTLTAVLELSTTAFAYELNYRSAGEARQTYAASGRGRITVRTVGVGSESAREYPGGVGVVLLDDSVFALYLQAATQATEAGAHLTGLFPRSGKRVRFMARQDRRPAKVGDATLRKIELTGELTGTIYVDDGGRLERVEIPAKGIEAIRLHR